jgi:hypothetical protein
MNYSLGDIRDKKDRDKSLLLASQAIISSVTQGNKQIKPSSGDYLQRHHSSSWSNTDSSLLNCPKAIWHYFVTVHSGFYCGHLSSPLPIKENTSSLESILA